MLIFNPCDNLDGAIEVQRTELGKKKNYTALICVNQDLGMEAFVFPIGNTASLTSCICITSHRLKNIFTLYQTYKLGIVLYFYPTVNCEYTSLDFYPISERHCFWIRNPRRKYPPGPRHSCTVPSL